MHDVFILAGRRTAIGRFNGALAGASAVELGIAAVRAAVADADLNSASIDELVMGQVLTAGQGQNPARQTAMGAGLPVAVPASTVNAVCGSGMQAIALAARAIRAGDSALAIAGGQESMSRAPHVMAGLRAGVKMGDVAARDSMIVDGLWDAFNDVHMGLTAEHLARSFQMTRQEQDSYAFDTQRKAAAAMADDRFRFEIVPVTIAERRGSRSVATDEQPMPDTTVEKLAILRPAFDPEGSVTAGNASSLNDGAAAVVIAGGSRFDGRRPRARIAAAAIVGVEPMLMGLGPVEASTRALRIAGWSTSDLDLIEVNEAFAAVAIAVNRRMDWDPGRVNVNGGAIALGHPIGASGARLVVSLLHEMERRNVRRGLATLCIGGGMGIAMCLERELD